MKTINDLTVERSFRVGICNFKVSDEVYNGLCRICDTGVVDYDYVTREGDKNMLKAFEWLRDNINISDNNEWNFEIYNINNERN